MIQTHGSGYEYMDRSTALHFRPEHTFIWHWKYLHHQHVKVNSLEKTLESWLPIMLLHGRWMVYKRGNLKQPVLGLLVLL